MLKKRLFGILGLILLALLIGLAGCNTHTEYHFKGKIGEEQIEARETLGWIYNGISLEVTKPDGSKIIYRSKGKDNAEFVLSSVTIIAPDGNEVKYRSNYSNPLVKNLLQEAQKQFEEYLEKIHKIKTAPLYR